jgi:hypothetical protein
VLKFCIINIKEGKEKMLVKKNRDISYGSEIVLVLHGDFQHPVLERVESQVTTQVEEKIISILKLPQVLAINSNIEY